MKKLMTLVLGAAIAFGAVTAYAAPQEKKSTAKKGTAKKSTKKKAQTPKKDGGK